MPTLTYTRDLGLADLKVDLNDVVCQFAFTTMDGEVAYGLIGSKKFHKHVLPVDLDSAKSAQAREDWGIWEIVLAGKGKQTALAPASFGTIRPLYELFAKDFMREFQKKREEVRTNHNGAEPIGMYAQLEYKREELPVLGAMPPPEPNQTRSSVTRGFDVKGTIPNFSFNVLEVGAIVRLLAPGKIKQSLVAGPVQTGGIPIVSFQHGPYPK
jgi:hypothetical protein